MDPEAALASPAGKTPSPPGNERIIEDDREQNVLASLYNINYIFSFFSGCKSQSHKNKHNHQNHNNRKKNTAKKNINA